MTLGEKRVRVRFNIAGSGEVDHLKQWTAQLIDDCEKMKHKDPRLCALAQTAYEEAVMWAVKLATADSV
jgi:hypothetical protein